MNTQHSPKLSALDTTPRAAALASPAWALSAAVLLALGASACSLSSDGTASAAVASEIPQTPAQRGEHLVLTSGCHDCHTPWKLGANGPEPDMSRMLSGHPESMGRLPPPPSPSGPWLGAVAATNTAWSGPWGISHTANLTPDADTGLGKWTKDDFVNTIKTGRHMGRGREILPPMPIPAYRNFTVEELEAIFAYLQTIPAIQNRVPEPVPPAGSSS